MEDSANLPPPDQIAEEIAEDLRAALEQLEEDCRGSVAGDTIWGWLHWLTAVSRELPCLMLGLCGGPSGIRTQDRRIKSQWLQPQNSPKTASKNRETAGKQLKTAGKRQVSGHLPDTKWQQWQHLKKGEMQASGQKSTNALI